jgi:hypothetical protein
MMKTETPVLYFIALSRSWQVGRPAAFEVG